MAFASRPIHTRAASPTLIHIQCAIAMANIVADECSERSRGIKLLIAYAIELAVECGISIAPSAGIANDLEPGVERGAWRSPEGRDK
ncbi:hypothetical protein C8R44DRAFT_768630 [Mycena epipterygia]|nr:hypothetical protein C8R44DRAFT_768630 [Mycena epipterygia]